MKILVLFSFLISVVTLFSQNKITQNIRGKVLDAESQTPLMGVTVFLVSDSSVAKGTVTDDQGNYRLESVAIGKQTLRYSFMGYKTQQSTILLTSARELVFDISMQEDAILMNEVQVTATKRDETINEMALVSARQFTVEETQRYAGSRGDPARMASNFAGVLGTDDSRNDIVVRGNSPLGVVWLVEGINIPNPNHFAVSGSQGGPVSIINNKVMGNSDFFTSAFPAEYGNSLSGIFDLKLRNGDNQKHEGSFQFGFLGTELSLEGPLSKKDGSSYMATYRYSTVGLFSLLGINIGTDAVPKYQDASFKLNFPIRKGNLSFWAIGGKSDIDILISNQTKPSVDLYGQNDRDQYFNTGMAVGGITLTKSVNDRGFIKATFGTSIERQKTTHNYIARHLDTQGSYQLDSIFTILDYDFIQGKNSVSFLYNQKIGARGVLKTGINTDHYLFNFQDSVFNDYILKWNNRFDYQGEALLFQPYIQYKYALNEKWTAIGGLHAQYFTLNNSSSWFEPRINLKWDINQKQKLSIGYGKHSQLQPMYTYFYHLNDALGNRVLHNKNMDLSMSDHFVMGYDRFFNKGLHVKAEVYYQNLYQIPVQIKPSAFSMINMGSGFGRFFPDSLKNTGTGTNYGIEFTLQKAFDKSFFFMITGSLYESKYKGSDGVERNTSYNGNYAVNALISKEFKLSDKSAIALGTKATTAGGRRYGLVDVTASNYAREVIFLDSLFNEFQFKDYFRLDLKINWIYNRPKVTHEIGLDLVNVLNTKNILSITYAPAVAGSSNFTENYQLGFLPIFYYKIDF